jgi:Protein of unknown function (DUF2852)
MSTLIERVDEFGRPAWIALMVVSFVLCWPIGLIILGFLIGSGRMSCWSHGNSWQTDRWQRKMDRMQRGANRLQDGIRRMQEAAQRWGGGAEAPRPAYPGGSSGNRAFDEYREETLRRLEDEQREFLAFLERLRHAKDKAEFDQFMAERRNYRDVTPPPQPQ